MGVDELMRATFDGPPPDVRVSDGTVSMRYRRRALDLRSRAAAIALNAAIPWSVELDGGITELDADMSSGARLQSDGYLDAADRYEIELSGGASKLTVASV